MQKLTVEFERAKSLLQKSQRIVIISHKNPDGDTVGANLALRLALQNQWNKPIISACIDPLPSTYDFLPEVNKYADDFDLAATDLLITVDCGSHYMTKFHEKKSTMFSGAPPLINIDHHASNDYFGTINIVDDTAAAAVQILYHFLIYCGFKIDRNIATCLMAGLYNDTGSFMHSNVTGEVLEIASDLMWKGADFKTISRKQFHSMSVAQLKLYGKILERAHVNEKQIAVSVVTTADFDSTGASADDTTGAIDHLNSIPDGKFCCLLHEDRKGSIKGSFRSRVDHIDLSKLAGLFGGGGHKKAAGFNVPGRLMETSPKVRIEP